MGVPTMVLYGIGSISNSVKTRGLTTFLMVFYNQVMGLPAAWVGLGTALALIFDALVDPAVGTISDNTRSRLGRRHPYMYAAALPVALFFFAIWNPPTGLEPLMLFGYMMVCLLSIRLFDTFFELPASALIPELVEDYDKRTVLISIRVLCMVVGGLLMTVFAYQVAMKEQPDGSGGVLAKDGYFSYGVAGALVIFTTILIASIATHRFIPWLRKPQPKPPGGGQHLKDILATLSNRPFFTIVGSGALVFLVAGVTAGLNLYITLFYWGFSQAQLVLVATFGAAAGLIGAPLATPLSKAIGKKEAAVLGYIVGAVAELAPYFARLAGLMPEVGDPRLFPIVAGCNFITMTAWSMTGVFLTALIADVVEDNAVKIGKRTEGLLFAADSLFKKIGSAGGPAVAGLILTLADFPIGAKRGEVDPEILTRLIWFYLPTLIAIYTVSISLMWAYNINRTKHLENLRILAERGDTRDGQS